jgi:hypothetical protein
MKMGESETKMDERPLRLFVVGESSGNPEEWSEWGSWSIVFAKSPEEAIAECGDLHGDEIAEVRAESAGIIFTHFPPASS